MEAKLMPEKACFALMITNRQPITNGFKAFLVKYALDFNSQKLSQALFNFTIKKVKVMSNAPFAYLYNICIQVWNDMKGM